VVEAVGLGVAGAAVLVPGLAGAVAVVPAVEKVPEVLMTGAPPPVSVAVVAVASVCCDVVWTPVVSPAAP